MSDFYTVKDQTLRNINAKQYVSGQITIDMMKDISDLGITLIINNRPDYEEEGQASSEELMKKAESLGIKFINIPFAANTLDKEKIINFSNLIKNNEQKALYFCRSGARSSTIWGIASVLYLDKDINEVMNKINNIGYDSSVLPNMVEHFKTLE
jgi:uncharacterized protein (TIGR01244 family)|tara:strand:+ start:1205 stop:1666 length:462 start_codon:yes stop_codon:yes gene_type:complete